MRRLDDEDRVGDQYTKEQMDEICPRDSKGRFLKSTADRPQKIGELGRQRPPNSRKLKILEAKLKREHTRAVQEAAKELLSNHLGEVLEAVRQKALQGDSQAQSLFLRHSMPVAKHSDRVDPDTLEHIANLPADERLAHVSKAMLEGTLDVGMGRQLQAAIKEEMQANTIGRLQRLAKRATREQISVEDLLAEFAAIANDLEPVLLEGETIEE